MNETALLQIPKEIDAGFEILAKETHTTKIFHIERALDNYLRQFRKLSFKINNTSESEPDLNKIDVTVKTKDVYQARLQRAKESNAGKESLNSPFLSSSPVDLGYTDSSLLDKIITGEE